jgi:hypothetical protein
MNLGAVAGVVVGAVLLVSGVLKLAAPAWPDQAAELGAPRWTVPVVPWVEIALGAALVAGVARPVAGVLAAGLLAAFTVLLVARLREGRRPPCACFGRLSRRPLGWGSVARNVVLVAAALLAATA